MSSAREKHMTHLKRLILDAVSRRDCRNPKVEAGSPAVVQTRGDGSSGLRGITRQGGEKWLLSQYIWKLKATGHADGLILECERKKRNQG